MNIRLFLKNMDCVRWEGAAAPCAAMRKGAYASTPSAGRCPATPRLHAMSHLMRWCLAGMLVVLPFSALAQDQNESAPQTQPSVAQNAPDADATSDNDANQPSQEETKSIYDDPSLKPRDVYNLALDKLNVKRFDEAIEGFSRARDDAGKDNELRFSAAYNLAMTYAARADAKGDPNQADEAALQAMVADLELSIAWFRDAVRQRPSIDEARQNLEIVLKRSRAVADILQQKFNTLEHQIEAVLGAQQNIRNQTRSLSEQVQNDEAQNDPSNFRADFKSLASIQRQTLTDANLVAENAADALAKLEAVPEEERAQEDAMRAFQLKMATPILEQARQQMAHARSRLRDLSMADAWRLVNQAYYLLKQAREQFDEPLATLQHLIQDQGECVRLVTTRMMLVSPETLQAMRDKNPEADIKLPNWLNLPLLADTQADALTRTNRLVALLEAMSEGAKNSLQNDQQQDPAQTEQIRAQIEQIDAALPLIREAADAMQAATAEISEDDMPKTREVGEKALKKLALAAERFADLKHLIEIAYATQTALSPVVAGAVETGEKDENGVPVKTQLSREEQKMLLSEGVASNIDRLVRLSDLLATEAAKTMDAQAQAAQGQPVSDEQKQQIQQMFEMAEVLRKNAEDANRRLAQKMLEPQNQETSEITANADVTTDIEQAPALEQNQENGEWVELAEDAKIAEESLEQLRMIFFTVVEHVAELMRQQEKTLDQMTDIVSEPIPDAEKVFDPVVDRERVHEMTAEKLAEVLQEQSKKMQSGEGQQGDQAQMAEMAQRYTQAASELQVAATAMRQVGSDLTGEEKHPKEAIEGQQTALEHIKNALELLQPPQQQQQQQQQEQQQQQQQQQQQMSQDQVDKKSQQIRSREQERRKQREQRQGNNMPTVEKDW